MYICKLIQANCLRQAGYVFISISWLVCLFAGFRKIYPTDFRKIGSKGGKWATEETTKFQR